MEVEFLMHTNLINSEKYFDFLELFLLRFGFCLSKEIVKLDNDVKTENLDLSVFCRFNLFSK